MDHAFAGVAAGVSGTLVGYPLEVVKTRMQATGAGAAASARGILSEFGLRGFYRGVALPLAALTVLNAQTFAFYADLSRRLGDVGAPAAAIPALAGAGCAPAAALISTPLELLKVRVALGAPSVGSAASEAWRSGSLFRGHGINMVRETVFLSVYFGTYERIKADPAAPMWRVAAAGGLAGAAGWLVSFPLDCVKTNVQRAQGSSPSPVTVAAVARALAAQGILRVYRGLGPSISRAFVVSSMRFSVYELVIDAWRQQPHDLEAHDALD